MVYLLNFVTKTRQIMEKFQVTVLGCASAQPSLRHFPSAHVVNVHEHFYLVDCGEGTQVQFRRAHMRFAKLDAIFITHLHGDHCLGLPGLLSTMSLRGRQTPIDIFGPSELEVWLRPQLQQFGIAYPVNIHVIKPTTKAVIFEDKVVSVETIPLRHRISCCGYLFRERASLPHIRRDMIDFYKIPHYSIAGIKAGSDWITSDGRIIPNCRLVKPAECPRCYAYCSDTIYLPKLAEQIQGVSLLYHEATYGEEEQDLARERFHTTARQAAQVACDAHVGKLLIGHYSARYHDLKPLLLQAQELFPNTILANEMLVVSL